MSYRADKLVIDTHTDTQTHRMTIPEGQNWPRVKTYSPRWFHRTWDGANQSSYCRVTSPARIWVPDRNAQVGAMSKWSCCCTSMGQGNPMEHEMAWIGPIVGELQHPQGRPGRADVTAPSRKAWSSWWTCCCTPTDQDGTIELEMESIVFCGCGVTVSTTWTDGRVNGGTDGKMDGGYYFKVPLTFLQKEGDN